MASAELMNNIVMIEFQLRKNLLVYVSRALLTLMAQEVYSVMGRSRQMEINVREILQTFASIVRNILKHQALRGMVSIAPLMTTNLGKISPQAPQAHCMIYKLHHLEVIIYEKTTKASMVPGKREDYG
uniref:Uncharacterized protein n=1 Tax=Arundo donax TaxID=35708 RepID=A0A0A9DSB7_ARUDO